MVGYFCLALRDRGNMEVSIYAFLLSDSTPEFTQLTDLNIVVKHHVLHLKKCKLFFVKVDFADLIDFLS